MPFKVSMLGEENKLEFLCGENETILEAAERSGYSLPYSCRKGVCSTCEGTLVSGSVIEKQEDVAAGLGKAVRLCVTRPCSDIEVKPQYIRNLSVITPKRMVATIHSIEQPADNVSILGLRLPIGKRCKFTAGQYLMVYLDDQTSRNYSFANAPQKSDMIELHIRHVPGGRFSDAILSKLEKGSELDIEVPYGQFSIKEDSDAPVILMATGTGFAPVKSMIEDQIAKGSKRSVEFYWGQRTRNDLYLFDLIEKWAQRQPWFHFKPVLSRPDTDWKGRSGWVQDAILADHSDLSGREVYACGNPDMISSAREILVKEAGLSLGNFFCDPFVSAVEEGV
ncbi:MAG: 2Fe-2S iron-sulfur cluster binding domain-containing protein [Emcibacter sp.]|nr:2Fe-2S iron-sulfur cluster binding domain-containing protein [Emcibacter sp.]